MLTYNDIYEILRKEKYSEVLQPLSKNFLKEFGEYLNEKNDLPADSGNIFTDSNAKSKKQLENSISLFKELILRRKKKILNLVFIATETGMTKRDYENMLPIERETFDKMVRSFEDCDHEITRMIHNQEAIKENNKLVLFTQEVEQFIDSRGKIVGPFKVGEMANLPIEISKILITEGKGNLIDEE